MGYANGFDRSPYQGDAELVFANGFANEGRIRVYAAQWTAVHPTLVGDDADLVIQNGQLINNGQLIATIPWVDGVGRHKFDADILNTSTGEILVHVNPEFPNRRTEVVFSRTDLTYQNHGRIDIHGGNVQTSGQGWVNSGEVEVAAGRTFSTGTTFLQTGGSTSIHGTIDSGSNTLQLDGGTLTGLGIIRDNVQQQGGDINPGPDFGTLQIQGNLTQDANSKLNVDLGGIQAGEFDRITVSGSAQIAGELFLSVDPSAVFQENDQLSVLQSQSLTGSFAETNASQHGFQFEQDATQVVLNYAPEPTGELTPEDIRNAFNAAIVDLQLSFPQITPLFNVSELNLPIIDGRLNSLFRLNSESGPIHQFASKILQTVDVAAQTYAQLGNEINSMPGVTLVCIYGQNGCEEDYLKLAVDYEGSPQSSTSPLDDTILSQLPDMIPGTSLDGEISWSAVPVIQVNIGVDEDGYFFEGEGFAKLQIEGNGTVQGEYSLLSDFSTSATGRVATGQTPFEVALHSTGPNDRYRTGVDLIDSLNAISNGDLTTTLQQTVQPLGVSWGGEWTATLTDNALSSSSDVQFPSQDEFLVALLNTATDQLSKYFDNGIVATFESLVLPFAESADFAAPGLPDGIATANDESDSWFSDLLKSFKSYLQWDLAEDQGQLVVPEDIGLGRGTRYSAGDQFMGTAKLRRDLNLSGQGIKIGVISDGVRGLRSVQRGDHPEIRPDSVTIHPTYKGGRIGRGSGAEGTAMIEIIQDVAPDAQIYFVGVGGRHNGSKAFRRGIDWFISKGVDIIIDDIGYPYEPMFELGTNTVAAKVASIIESDDPKHDVLFVSSAGNDNQNFYRGELNPKTFPDGELRTTNRFHQFFPNDRYLPINVPGKKNDQSIVAMVRKVSRSGI